MLGTTLGGRYQIDRYLGGGGFGRTYLAHDQHLPGTPDCVVKQLKPKINHPRAYATACRLFNQEAEVLYLLGEHDRIPRLFAHFEEQQEFYLVQEYVDGEVLSRILRTGHCLSETAVIQLLKELLDILMFVHEQQVIHRDIKPSNLIRRQDGTLVMIDFGGVKQISSDPDLEWTATTMAIGSAGYMPNEQLAGRPRFSSDIYAAGMVALRAVTGCSPAKLPEDIRTGELNWRDRAPHISDALAHILTTMTRYDFRERYATAAETLLALEAIAPDAAADPTDPTAKSKGLPIRLSTMLTRCDAPIHPVPSPTGNGPSSLARDPSSLALSRLSFAAWVDGPMSMAEELTGPLQQRIEDQVIEDQMEDQMNMPQAIDDPSFAAAPTESMLQAPLPAPFEQLPPPPSSMNRPVASAVFAQPPPIQSPAAPPNAVPLAEEYPAHRANTEAIKTEATPETDDPEPPPQGDHLFQEQQYGKAIVAYRQQLDAEPDNYILWFKQAMALEYLNHYEEAIACYRTVIKLQPQDYLAWSKLGKALEVLEQHDEAVDAYTQVIQIQPQNYWAWHDQGRALESSEHIETAIASYEQAIQLKPDFQLAIDSRKRLLCQLNQVERLYHLEHYDEALQSCLETVETRPDDPLAWLMQGMTLENAQYYQAAIDAYDKVLQLDPSDHLARLRRGEVFEKLGNYHAAIEAYRDVTRFQPQNHWAWGDLGRVLETVQDYEQSIAAYGQALKLQPTFDTALTGRDRVLGQLQRTTSLT